MTSSPRPRVLVLSFSPIARDPRVLRQVRLFSQSADVVTLGYGPAPDGVVQHIEVPPELKPWRTERFHAPALFLLGWYHRLYFGSERMRFVQRAVPPGSVDVVVANDALGAPVALTLAPRGGVHVDLHEFAPRQGATLAWRLRVAPFMRWACRRVRRADSVTTVAPGIAAEYAHRFGFTPAVVPNAASYRDDIAPTAPGTPLRLVHIGIAGRARKLEIMVDAVAEVERRAPGSVTFDLVLAPGDPTYITELEEHAAAVAPGVVRVLPPVPFDRMVDTLAGYDVGIFICPPTTFNLEHALPNKFFEFAQARLGIVVGPSPEMAPLVEQHGLGVVAAGFDVQATADAIARLDAAGVARFKAASDAAARELSSERLSQPWTDAVDALVAVARGTSGAPGAGAGTDDRPASPRDGATGR